MPAHGRATSHPLEIRNPKCTTTVLEPGTSTGLSPSAGSGGVAQELASRIRGLGFVSREQLPELDGAKQGESISLHRDEPLFAELGHRAGKGFADRAQFR